MSATVTVTRNFSLDAFALTTADDMRELGLMAREQIVRRTLGSRDVENAPFAPYSPEYAKAKGSSFVNLQVSGNMLNDLGITALDDDSVTLGWTK
jgi:hypothetical protein